MDLLYDERNWAEFTAVPEPDATLSLVVALATLGVVARWRWALSSPTNPAGSRI